MAPTTKPKPRKLSVFIRLDDREQARVRKQAGREPLATWAKRILLEHVTRREAAAKGGEK